MQGDLSERVARRGLAGLLATRALLFVLLAASGSAWSWGVFSPLHAEVAADLWPGGASPWDAYDGLVAGPLAMGLLEAPLLLVLGRSPLVHLLVTLALTLGAVVLAYVLVRRLCSRRAALAAAALVAFPPPVTWFHQHMGAHHVLMMLTVPAGLLLLGAPSAALEEERPRLARRGAGWLLLVLTPTVAPSGIALAVPLAGLWLATVLWGLARRRRAGRALTEVGIALSGAAVALTPVLYKGLVHVPFGGGVPAGGVSAAGQTKPLFLAMPGLTEMPGRLAHMVAVELPAGLHYGLHGLSGVGLLFTAVGLLAFALLCWRLARGDRGGWWILLALPPTVLLVGLLTGWWSFHPGSREPFPRESRHLLGVAWVLMILIGVALDRLPRRAEPVGWLLVGLLVVLSLFSQAREVRWQGLPPASAQTTWRLEGRALQGFFAGPALRGAPEELVGYCEAWPEPRRSDCLQGAAMSIGEPGALGAWRGPEHDFAGIRSECAALSEASAGSVGRLDCFFGLGFGLSHLGFRAPGRDLAACRRSRLLAPDEQDACVQGVAWGVAQDFWNRPSAMRRWLVQEVEPEERATWARGVGALVGSLNTDPDWRTWQCGLLVGSSLAEPCLESAQRSPHDRAPPTLAP